jgi:hypothetical protein
MKTRQPDAALFGSAWVAVGAVAMLCSSSPAQTQTGPAEQPIPLSALAPENLSRPRPTPPFDLTGNWFVDLRFNEQSWHFGPPYPKLTAKAQEHFDASQRAAAEDKLYRDDIGQCWPAGMPLIMTRVWPISMIQLPTAIFMISHFMNSLRVVYTDGRPHTDPDLVVPSFNGESIGRWEGDTLVVHTRHFVDHHHWMDQGGIAIPAGAQLSIVERVRLVDDGQRLEIEYTMTDPEHWEGEWKSMKRFNRVNDVDLTEVTCFPDMNDNLPATRSQSLVN